MLLAAVDVGNTRFHVGLFAPFSGGVRLVEFRHGQGNPAPFFKKWKAPVLDVAYASVNPGIDIEKAIRAEWNVRPAKMGRDFPAAIRNRTHKPKQTGMDRLANAVAAWHRTRRAVVVAGLGTAITFDVVNGKGEFIGGAIAPGLRLQSKALAAGTAQLPLALPKSGAKIGKTTEQAIQAGVEWGINGLIEEGFRRIAAEAGGRPRFLGTGGDAQRFQEHFDEIVPHLTVEGIALSFLAHG